MKKLFYISSPQLGETLFATPALDFLSKEYEIYLFLSESVVPVFKNYSFIKKIITCDDNWRAEFYNVSLNEKTFNQIKECFGDDPKDIYYAYHHDDDNKLIKTNSYFEKFKSIPIQRCNDYLWSLSRCRKYLVKLGLIHPLHLDEYDCTIRCPAYNKGKGNDLIIYQGSRELNRKLPLSTLEHFVNIVPNAIFMVEYSTALRLKLKEKGIKAIYTMPLHDDNLKNAINCFESGPKAIICPDAGYTQLALRYKIPMIWLESRVKSSRILDPQSMKGIKIYRKETPSCDCTCDNRKATVNWWALKCKQDINIPCLTYTEEEVKYILSMITDEWLNGLRQYS